MKKLSLSFLFLSLTASLFVGGGYSALADTTTPNATTSNETDNGQVDASTTASVFFEGGTISLYHVQDAAKFNTDATAFNAGTIFTNGLKATATNKVTATVDDFLGQENGAWTLTVAKGKWAAGEKGAASGATALDKSAQLTVDAGEITTDGIKYATGNEGHNELTPQDLELSIDKGTVVKAGSYTNTLTWKLSNSVAETQD